MNSQHFKDLLHERALKATSPRLNLLHKMQEYKSAMPYSTIQEVMNSVDRVTLYRTLESLKEKGIIHMAYQESNETYYAICGHTCGKNQHEHNHVHFRCVKCASVTCEQPSQSIKISIPENEIHKVSIYLEGLCRLCKE